MWILQEATFFTKGIQGFTRKRHVSSTHNHMEVKRPCERHSSEYFDALVKWTDSNDFKIPGTDGIEGSAIILRPRRNANDGVHDSEDRGPSSGCYNVLEDNIVVEKSRLLNLNNECSKRHQDINTCEDMNWDLVDFEPWGLFSSVILRCTLCWFCSPRTKLYEEVNQKAQVVKLLLEMSVSSFSCRTCL